MNERIQELWDKAAESTKDDSWQSHTLFMERFAELIVKECIGVITKHDYHGEWLGEKIKEHFGVGE